MNLRLDEISKAVNGVLSGPPDQVASGYSIDTRTLKPRDLFLAIKGPNFNGHDFVGQAMSLNTAAVVVEEGDFRSSTTFGVIRVRSTVAALQDLALYVRRRWGKPIIGVTGSAGKTTTREMIAAVLAKRFDVLKSVGNLNN